MYTKLAIIFALVALAAAEFQTTFQPTGEISNKILRRGFGQSVKTLPPDDGFSNYGDYLYNQRVQGDVMLTQEVQINAVTSGEQALRWTGNFPGYRITHIRFLNIGRQRGYTKYVRSTGSSSAEAEVGVPPYAQFRLLIEVYGTR